MSFILAQVQGMTLNVPRKIEPVTVRSCPGTWGLNFSTNRKEFPYEVVGRGSVRYRGEIKGGVGGTVSRRLG